MPLNGVRSIKPLPAVTRRAQVVEALREAILSGSLLPGTRITEQDLASRLKVSRGPIREAIRELINDGLLESQPYSGTYVSVIGERAIAEAYGLRGALEKYAFTLIWTRRDADYRAGMVRRHDALLAAAKAESAAAELAAEIDFHGFPSEFSGHELLRTTWRHVAGRMQLGFILHRASPDSPDSAAMHERYLALALGNDLAAMLEEVDAHLALGVTLMNALPATNDRARA